MSGKSPRRKATKPARDRRSSGGGAGIADKSPDEVFVRAEGARMERLEELAAHGERSVEELTSQLVDLDGRVRGLTMRLEQLESRLAALLMRRDVDPGDERGL